ALDLVLPPAFLALAAVDEGVGERGQVAGGLPHSGRHEDGGVKADDVVAQLHHRPPPGVHHVALQQHAQRPVVIRRPEPAVDIARREDEAAPLAQVDDLLHAVGRRLGHDARAYRPTFTNLSRRWRVVLVGDEGGALSESHDLTAWLSAGYPS